MTIKRKETMNLEEVRLNELYPKAYRLAKLWIEQNGQMPWIDWFKRMGIFCEHWSTWSLLPETQICVRDVQGRNWFESERPGNWVMHGWSRKQVYHQRKQDALNSLYEKAWQLLEELPIQPQHYAYLGDTMTAQHLKHWRCHAILQPNGKTIRGKNGSMLVRFGNTEQAVVLGRLLRKIEITHPKVLQWVPGKPHFR